MAWVSPDVIVNPRRGSSPIREDDGVIAISSALAVDLSATLVYLWFLYVMWVVWIYPCWVNRRVPIRKTAPTGDQPWVKPYSRK